MPKALVKLRRHQEEVFWREDRGIFAQSWRRRAGKSFGLGARAIRRMIARPNHTIAFLSASLATGRELLAKETAVWGAATSSLKRSYEDSLRGEAQTWIALQEAYKEAATEGGKLMESNIDGLDLDAVMEVFEAQKLETKIWHSRTVYSRTLVLAANPDTAVGYGGDVYLDEYGRIENFKEVLEAVLPFMDESPDLECILSSTPPPDDSHYSYELTVPPADFDIDALEPNPRGHWYKAESGIWVHRVDAWDTHAGGIPLYHPVTREACTPEEHRAAAFDKEAWDRNFGVRFISGGTAAVSRAALHSAMQKGLGRCVCNNVSEALTL